MSRPNHRLGDLARYGAALAGTAGSSGAQFLLTLALLGRMPPADFARYSFLMIVSQLVWGLGGALFSAPLASLLAHPDSARAQVSSQAVVRLQPLFALACAVLSLTVALLIGAGLAESLVYAVLVAAGGIRQFLRVAGYSEGRQARIVGSDLLYTACVLGLTATLALRHRQDLYLVLGILTAGHLIGLLPLLRLLPRALAQVPTRASLGEYRRIWRESAAWSLIGLIATETTGNAHSYIVTAIAGPGGFAAVAASTVLSKPGTVALNALSELERARMARLCGPGDRARLIATRRLFRAVALAAWLATAGLTWAALHGWPRLLFHDQYDLHALRVAGWLWTAAMLIRCLYLPEAVEMQARGAFSELAWPRILGAPVSLAGSLLLVLMAPPEWTIVAICLGEGLSALALLRAHARLTGRQGCETERQGAPA